MLQFPEPFNEILYNYISHNIACTCDTKQSINFRINFKLQFLETFHETLYNSEITRAFFTAMFEING